MIKRTIEISQRPVHLTVKDGQLLIQARDDERAVLSHAPCEDIGVLLVEQPGTTYTHAALTALLSHDAAVVFCGRDHLPAGLLLPFAEHTKVVQRLRLQLAVKRPLQKQLWRQIVQAKIRAQAMNLAAGSTTRSRLLGYARNVKSDDASNLEAQAARAYWGAWLTQAHSPQTGSGFPLLDSQFRRHPDGPAPNNLLNYGYAVIRAAVARAIVSAGLLPALGLHHTNRSNAFCLADDLVEPLRPMVDRRVRDLWVGGCTELDSDAKRGLLELLTCEVVVEEQSGPLMVALHRYVGSLVQCYLGEERQLRIPVESSDV